VLEGPTDEVSRIRLAALLWCVALLLVAWRFTPAAPDDDHSGNFAGEHAYRVLERLVPDDTPHPLGSRAQEDMYQRVEAEIRALGLEPRSTLDWSCSPLGQCGRVRNLVVQIEGEHEDAVLFSAHTDSAMAGPGAGDDAHGVAVLLELARHIVRGTVRPENSVILLFTDGEEEGLLGAYAFVERNPLAARVAAAVNLEARGNSGLSMLFQTLGEDSWLIEAYAQEARDPYCSSMAQAVYEMMPHYTDLSALHTFGIPGVDFAFIDGEAAYHSPLDRVEDLSPRSLQSQGDNALAMLRSLGSADLRDPHRGYATWFDLLGLFVVRVPRGAMFPAALFIWITVLAALFQLRRKKILRARAVLAQFGIALLALSLTALVGWTLCSILESASGDARFWKAHPWPITIALALAAVAIQVEFARRSPPSEAATLLGHLLVWTTIGLPIALFAPGSAYLFVAPALCASLVALFFVGMRARSLHDAIPWVCGSSALLTMALWLPLIHGLRLALGVNLFLGVCVAFAGLPLWPLYRQSRRGMAPVLSGLCLLLALATLVQGADSAEVPARQWLTRVVEGDTVRVVRGPGPVFDSRLRIWGEELPLELAPEVLDDTAGLGAPRLEDLRIEPSRQESIQLVSVRVASASGAPSVILSIPEAAKLHEFHVEDTGMDRGFIKSGDNRIEIHNLPPEGVRVLAQLEDPSVPWRIADRRAWSNAPESLRKDLALTSWDGDTTWVITEMAPTAVGRVSP
jgi:hypothetical protein